MARFFLLGFLLLAPPASPAPAGRSVADKMLAAHNAIRKRVGVPPLAWSEKLAAAAKQWANHLIESGKFYDQPNDRYGENAYEIMGATASPEEVVKAWASEAQYYNYKKNSCSKVCGHYTQLVWKNSKQVGCAASARGSRQVWICEYNPPGNYVGKRPY